jgi:hypothetical protein
MRKELAPRLCAAPPQMLDLELQDTDWKRLERDSALMRVKQYPPDPNVVDGAATAEQLAAMGISEVEVRNRLRRTDWKQILQQSTAVPARVSRPPAKEGR